jgi:phosphatidylinositol phospholipase C delta
MQRFDASLQLNEALFATSDGYILKPAALRAGGRGVLATGRKRRLRVHVAGATDVPLPRDRDRDDEIRPYVTCTLVHPGDVTPPKRKTGVYRPHKLGILHRGDVENPPVTDPVWREELEWEFEENELVFLRTLVKSDDRFARNPVLCVAAVRLTYVVSDWVFVRMLDLKGKETHCTVLMKFEMSDV